MAAPMARAFQRRLPGLITRNFFGLHRQYANTSVHKILEDGHSGQNTTLTGWVKGIQKLKGVTFLHLIDGSGPHHLQVVLPESIASTLVVTYGSCVNVEGVITKSQGKGQNIEMLSTKVEILGLCDTTEFPFKQKQRHPPRYARDFPHLRPKTQLFSALLRIRNEASMAVHKYFQRENYVFIHTPILTSSDCEGACEVFQVEPLMSFPTSESESETDFTSHEEKPSADVSGEGTSYDNSQQYFFKSPTYLTVSGQLHLEVITGALKKAYNFGPTFRAESSGGSFHLSEFYMVEAEIAFTKTLEDILKVMEDLVKYVYKHVRETCSEDYEYYTKMVAAPAFSKSVDKMMQSKFERISYTDAIDLLLKSNQDFLYEVTWGSNLMKEHEMYVTEALGGVPVFVTDYPTHIKPFYAKKNPDPMTVAASDLLVPQVGELCGSSLREDRLDVLSDVMHKHGLDQHLDWYLDLCRFGSCPHGGFGLGFERLLMFMLGAPSVKDVIPFPRWPGRCQL